MLALLRNTKATETEICVTDLNVYDHVGVSQMLQTWRMVSVPPDLVKLQDVRQAGAEGVVTSLHHLSPGDVWPVREIEKRKAEIESAGLRWSVVERR